MSDPTPLSDEWFNKYCRFNVGLGVAPTLDDDMAAQFRLVAAAALRHAANRANEVAVRFFMPQFDDFASDLRAEADRVEESR